MREYIEKLRDELNSILERPVTLGRAEEAAKYAEAIQALEAMHGHYKGCDRLSVDDAIKWTLHMENADGTTGPHWTMEQTTAVAESMGIHHEHDVLGLLRRGDGIRRQSAGILRGFGKGVFDGQGRTGAGGKAVRVLQVYRDAWEQGINRG